MMKQKTVVEWLVERLAENGILHSSDINQAKEMEREQIEEAYKADLHPCSDEDAEQYYNETYSK
jgi:hypothetical protein